MFSAVVVASLCRLASGADLLPATTRLTFFLRQGSVQI